MHSSGFIEYSTVRFWIAYNVLKILQCFITKILIFDIFIGYMAKP